MKSLWSILAGAAILAVAPRGAAGQSPPAMTVRAVRFWVPEYRQTMVKVFVQIPYVALMPSGGGPDGVLSYRVSVRVADSTGLTLMQQGWMKHTSAAVRVPGATSFEILEFAIAPGRYRLELAVEDSISGTRIDRGMDLLGFDPEPVASDLVISSRMRTPGPADSIPVQGELRRGNTIFTATALVELAPMGDRAKLYYYLEGYTQVADSGTLGLEIKDASGAVVLTIPTRTVRFAAGGGVVRGSLDLTGLPEGEFTLRSVLGLGGRTIDRSAPFRMGTLERALLEETQARAARLVSDSGYFGEMTAAELDEAFAPLTYLATSEDRMGVWSPSLSVTARRNFLVNFWRSRDPDSLTPRNEVREAFYARIDEANRLYTDQQRGSRPGWRTDMGRIFIRNGAPVETLRRAQVGLAPPYQAWRYSSARSQWYVFVDRTNFGSYELVTSTDPKEPTRPGWQDTLGPEALNDLGQFLGIDLIRRSRSTTQ